MKIALRVCAEVLRTTRKIQALPMYIAKILDPIQQPVIFEEVVSSRLRIIFG